MGACLSIRDTHAASRATASSCTAGCWDSEVNVEATDAATLVAHHRMARGVSSTRAQQDVVAAGMVVFV